MIYRTQDDLERAKVFLEKFHGPAYKDMIEPLAQEFAEIRVQATEEAALFVEDFVELDGCTPWSVGADIRKGLK